MAEGRDPIQEQLRRSHSLSLEVSHSTRPVRDGPNSSVSMEGLNAADIGEQEYVCVYVWIHCIAQPLVWM